MSTAEHKNPNPNPNPNSITLTQILACEWCDKFTVWLVNFGVNNSKGTLL